MELALVIGGGIYVASMGVIDMKRKKIPVMPGIVLFIIFVIIRLIWQTDEYQWLFGIIPAIVLFAVSKGSQGAVGEGDALVYGVTGVVLGLFKNIELLLISLFFCSLAAAFLFFFRQVGRNYQIPFVPFIALAYGLVVIM